jgi:hypothetical protein
MTDMPEQLFQFGCDEFNTLAETIYEQIGKQKLHVGNTWTVVAD